MTGLRARALWYPETESYGTFDAGRAPSLKALFVTGIPGSEDFAFGDGGAQFAVDGGHFSMLKSFLENGCFFSRADDGTMIITGSWAESVSKPGAQGSLYVGPETWDANHDLGRLSAWLSDVWRGLYHPNPTRQTPQLDRWNGPWRVWRRCLSHTRITRGRSQTWVGSTPLALRGRYQPWIQTRQRQGRRPGN